jgi:hypothetical protein
VRRALTIVAAAALLLGAAQAFGADKRKLRWVTSIYSDAKGIGIKYPEGVACGEKQFFVADTGNRRLLSYAYEGEVVTPLAEFPLPEASPVVVQVNSAGDVYFLDGKERRIESLSATGEEKGVLTPRKVPSSTEIVPKSFKIDDRDNVYVLDIFGERVLVLDSDGEYLRHVAFPEEYGFFSDLALDRQGRIFLVDSVEAVVYSAGKDEERFSPLGQSMKEYMNFPTSLASDNRGTLFLVDQYGSGVALVAEDGSFLGRKLGMGWDESRLYYPAQICISDDGNVLIADRSNNRIQLFTVIED